MNLWLEDYDSRELFFILLLRNIRSRFIRCRPTRTSGHDRIHGNKTFAISKFDRGTGTVIRVSYSELFLKDVFNFEWK